MVAIGFVSIIHGIPIPRHPLSGILRQLEFRRLPQQGRPTRQKKKGPEQGFAPGRELQISDRDQATGQLGFSGRYFSNSAISFAS